MEVFKMTDIIQQARVKIRKVGIILIILAIIAISENFFLGSHLIHYIPPLIGLPFSILLLRGNFIAARRLSSLLIVYLGYNIALLINLFSRVPFSFASKIIGSPLVYLGFGIIILPLFFTVSCYFMLTNKKIVVAMRESQHAYPPPNRKKHTIGLSVLLIVFLCIFLIEDYLDRPFRQKAIASAQTLVGKNYKFWAAKINISSIRRDIFYHKLANSAYGKALVYAYNSNDIVQLELNFFPLTSYEIDKLKKDADSGNLESSYSLGSIYQMGYGVDVNPVEAFKWYEKAANKGHTKAQIALGWAYFVGSGINQDKVLAIKWMKLAAESGNSLAKKKLQIIQSNGE